MCHEHRFEEAVKLLEPMSVAAHSRLVRYAARASQLLRQINAQWESGRREAEKVYEEAQHLISQGRIDRATDLLEAVPEGFRDPQFKILVDEMRGRRAEVARLSETVREALAAGRTTDALAPLARLLELRPDHTHARKLADQLQGRYIRAAEKKLSGGHVKVALRLLNEFPASLIGGSEADRFQRVAEWAALADGIHAAPVVDATLLSMAERLRAIGAEDAQSLKLVEEIERRWKRAMETDPLELPQWAAPPSQTALGFPVDFFPAFRRIVLGDKFDRQLLVAQRGRFAVACGLALQGIEKAEVTINLLPAGHRMGAIASLLFEARRRRPGASTSAAPPSRPCGLPGMSDGRPPCWRPPSAWNTANRWARPSTPTKSAS